MRKTTSIIVLCGLVAAAGLLATATPATATTCVVEDMVCYCVEYYQTCNGVKGSDCIAAVGPYRSYMHGVACESAN